MRKLGVVVTSHPVTTPIVVLARSLPLGHEFYWNEPSPLRRRRQHPQIGTARPAARKVSVPIEIGWNAFAPSGLQQTIEALLQLMLGSK